MIRALIFDFNGVLADDDPIHMEALRQVAQEEGMSFTDEEYLDRYRPEVIMFHAYYSPLEPPGPRAERSGLGPGWYRMCRTLQSYAEGRGYRLAAVFGRERDHTHSYYVRPGFADAAAIEAAIRDFDYAWYQDGMPSVNFARAEAGARP